MDWNFILFIVLILVVNRADNEITAYYKKQGQGWRGFLIGVILWMVGIFIGARYLWPEV